MAICITRRGNQFFRSRILAVVFSKFNCTLAGGEMERCSTIRPTMNEDISSVDTFKWKKKIYAGAAGMKDSITEPSLHVLRLLKRQGYDAYVVGGCVRDLILDKVPKDFDVVTTADLKQIRNIFHRAQVVGKRFPICHVWMKGSLIEVASFKTIAKTVSKHKNDSGKLEEKNGALKMPCGWDVRDCNLWKNSMHRDFTINSLFFDPFENKVYDYINGFEDLKDLKLRTLVPAHSSFKEDSARVLRGLRIAARLALSFSKDIEIAIPQFVSSIAKLDPVRIMMEMNYMLSYGAAEPSILLLMKFKLLHDLLPFQAAYLDQASKTSSPMSSLMLMRLFSNMDKVVFCDKPADCRLWIAILAFHIALVQNPQEAIVVRAFASLLYHGNWREALKFAREHENSVPRFAPEVSESSGMKSDQDLAKAVSRFISLVQDTPYVLTGMEDLRQALYLYPNFESSGRVFISKKKGGEVVELFARLSDAESYESKKKGFVIDYHSLKGGKTCEIGFVLGKIILNTMAEEVTRQKTSVVKKNSGPDYCVPAANNEKKHKSVFSKSNMDEQPRHDSKTSSIPMVKLKTLKRTREDGEEASVPKPLPKQKTLKRSRSYEQKKNKQETEMNPNLTLSSTEKKTLKSSRSDEQKKNNKETEMCLDLILSDTAENQDQSAKETPVTKPVKQKPSKKFRPDEVKNSEETVVSHDTTVAGSAKRGVVYDKSMSGLLNFIEKSNQKPAGGEEKKSESLKKTKRPRKLSSFFR